MRRDDEKQLKQPYDRGARDNPARLAMALGAPIPSVVELTGLIEGDLDAERFGIGWWAPHPGTTRRILISDHLYVCVVSLGTNLVESRLHLLEAKGFADEEGRGFVSAVTLDAAGRHDVQLPRSATPYDDAVHASIEMHVVGCVRALASALDVLGAAMIGVLALPLSIVWAGYKDVRKALRGLTNPRVHAIQQRAAAEIAGIIDRAGPAGWDDWVLGYRNMLVHRGRRLALSKLNPTGARLFSPHGRMIVPMEVVPVLPNDPGRSDVEVLRDGSERAFVLSESGWDTLEGAARSVSYVVENVARVLSDAWKSRRSDPSGVPQPRSQWAKVESAPSLFHGYAPGTVPFDATEFRTNPSFGRRLQAAALEDTTREKWRDFD